MNKDKKIIYWDDRVRLWVVINCYAVVFGSFETREEAEEFVENDFRATSTSEYHHYFFDKGN